ncbi:MULTISPECIES: MFS transporter [Pacificimonas]|uniref:MFS transporter n=1 Tax=Pacificimonas TaxID=1960290 RepID=UPI001CCCF5F9|nr:MULTISPECIES: MFS transporter [Pacificimonas]
MTVQPPLPSPPDDPEAEFQQFVDRNLKRNFLAHFTHGMLGMTGFRLVYAPTFVPAYLSLLTGSPFMVGLGQSLQQAGAILSPVLGAQQIEHRRRILPISILLGGLMRIQLLGLAIAGWFLADRSLVVATLIFLFLLGFFMGSQRVAFQVVLAKVIPIRRRGRLQAWRNLFGGGLAAGLSYWAGKTLIEEDWLGNGYATTFALAFVLTSIGLAVIARFMREPESPTVRTHMSLRERLSEFPALMKDRDYRNFLIAQLLTMSGRISIPFCILYAGETLGLSGSTVGLLSLAFLGADTVSNIIWGPLGDRFGFRLVYLISVALWALSVLLLLAAESSLGFFTAFAGLGMALSGYLMSQQTMVLEFGSRDDVPMRLALSTTVETSMATIGPLLGGAIVAYAGYQPVFYLTIACLVAALGVLLFAVREPRYRSPSASA